MRRTTAAVIGTLAGTALLTGLKLGTGTNAQDAGATAGDNAAAAPSGDPGRVPAPASSSRRPAKAARSSRSPRPARHRAPTTAAKKTPARTGTGLKDGTYTGASSTNKYGTIRVGITVSGGRMTAVRVSYPTSPSRTASINARAVPKLKQEALTAQSARVATVSGASYTSSSFRASLQSALTTARA